ncbi:outer membrane protein TolC [Aquimarina sp. MAR_2010_214]|uniref:TolC family protein n=1 Tax=Aquimarina sp. MAR_2010_214 TaxID=1250026 RepID=UPI000C708AC9|nr:TolC family protein [Aquimarina sp. MAR_2010_214]PKV49708.1 outer membrane protein TolC [Aquimarina sp. MAR_2010_214]
MKTLLKYTLLLFIFVYSEILAAQTKHLSLENVLTFEEYLGYVKKHHPLLKQADLILSVGEANLLKARGGFDPKIEVDYDRKKFKNTEYYDQLSATFKIPTWYGVEFKANFEENMGEFLNPNLTVPDKGLYSAGISFSLAQGFLINERMASLKKARFFREQTKADRDLLVNSLLFEASSAYLEWLKVTNEELIYITFLKNANTRLLAVERSVEMGEKAAIDITEARITLQNRQLNLEAASLKRKKAALIVSNYLWLNDVPMEIREEVVPVLPKLDALEASLLLEGITDTSRLLRNHPKLLSLDAKIDELTVERSLKLNKLLPKINIQYNFLTPKIDQARTLNTANYKAFVNFSFPLFLRKARGDLQLANLKLQDVNFERVSTATTLQNKIDAVYAEINSLSKQNQLIRDIVIDYKALVKAEERKFFLGESSLFIINSREQKLIDIQLKENKLRVKQLMATANLYNTLGLPI